MATEIRDAILRKLGINAESFQRIRLGQGVVGKTSFVAACFLIVIAILAVRVEPWAILWLAGIACGGFVLFIAVAYYFAFKNPAAALLEGSDLIQAKLIDAGIMDMPQIEPTDPIPDPKAVPPPTVPEPEVKS